MFPWILAPWINPFPIFPFHIIFILCLPSCVAREQKKLGTAAVQAKLFEEMPFQFNVEVERMVSAGGICRSMFICLCACARFCACAKCLPQRPYHLLTHLLLSKTEPPHTHFSCLLIKARSSHSCRFPFPCMGSPPPVELVWLGFNSHHSPCITAMSKQEDLLVSYYPWEAISCSLVDVHTGAATSGRSIKN